MSIPSLSLRVLARFALVERPFAFVEIVSAAVAAHDAAVEIRSAPLENRSALIEKCSAAFEKRSARIERRPAANENRSAPVEKPSARVEKPSAAVEKWSAAIELWCAEVERAANPRYIKRCGRLVLFGVPSLGGIFHRKAVLCTAASLWIARKARIHGSTRTVTKQQATGAQPSRLLFRALRSLQARTLALQSARLLSLPALTSFLKVQTVRDTHLK